MKKHILFVVSLVAIVILSACKAPAPEKVKDLTGKREDGVVLSWEKSEGAEFYRIYRKNNDTDDYRFMDDVKETGYSDASAEDDMSYLYYVEAVGDGGTSDGMEIKVEAESSGEAYYHVSLKAPVVTSVTRLDKYTAVIQFEDSNESCSYEIMRSSSLNGSYQAIGQTEENVYYDDTITSSNAYYYAVRALNDTAIGPRSAGEKIGKNAVEVKGVPVIMYHEFVTDDDLASGVEFDEYAIWKSEFEEDLKWLKKNGYTTITTRELSQFIKGEGDLPERPILLTIDDGKLGVYKNAYPLLKEYSMTASLAVIGSRIDMAEININERDMDPAPYCTWDEIGEMANSGAVEIISHTYGLHIFNHDGRHGASTAEGEDKESFLASAQKDYIKIQDKIVSAAGNKAVAMAYPYSKRTEVADEVWIEAGYDILLGGDDSNERKTHSNFYVRGTGINRDCAVARRLVRMTGTPLSDYIEAAVYNDSY